MTMLPTDLQTNAPTGQMVEIIASPEGAGERVDRFLAAAVNAEGTSQGASAGTLSRSRIKALVLDGHLFENDVALQDPSATVKAGSRYRLSIPEPADPTPSGEAIKLDILYEDPHIIIINKPAGMVVHPAPGNLSGTLVNAFIAHCGPELTGIGGVLRPGIVHRLDKETSGVMMAAKTEVAHQRLTTMFAAHDLDRRYLALLWNTGTARNGIIDEPIGRATRDRKRQAVTAKGRKAITHWEALRVYPPFGMLTECQLETGRTHQIRVHMAHIGHGVIGDKLYGRPPRAAQMPDELARACLAKLRAIDRQALHAAHLGFSHPVTGQFLEFTAPMPPDLADLQGMMETTMAARATSGR